MATYFHGNSSDSSIQPDGLQTLILMNPAAAAYDNYIDTQHQQINHHHHHHEDQHGGSSSSNNYAFFNSAAASGGGGDAGGYSLAQPHHTRHQPPHQTNHEISSLYGFIPRSWTSNDVQVVPQTQQGLSLSLSSSQPPVGFGSLITKHELPTHQQLSSAKVGEEMRSSGGLTSSASGILNGVPGNQNALLSSKYLKAAQQVLDEVVHVVAGTRPERNKKMIGQSKETGDSAVTGEGLNSGEPISKLVAELSTSEKHEVQMKKAKLVSMLDEVEQRYRHYHHQMQIVISSFEQAAGTGSAKTYTALALQTISKQFRCLKDTISGQIRAASKSLGEEGCLGGKTEGSSRLKFVDHHIRQQRALQQLGMVQHNAWRPQRGLPERSVSVLRAWLFEHFLHPYPKDSDKHILAKQTGLTRSQVSNWFINARVRLWKPMVEEMYLEEVKENEKNGTGDKSEHNNDSLSKSTSPKNTGPILDHGQSFKSKQENPQINRNISSISASTDITSPPGFGLIGYTELDGITQSSPKRARSPEMMHYLGNMQSMDIDMKPNEINNEQVWMNFGLERQDRDGYSLMGGPANFIGGFGSYPMGEMGRYETEHYQPPFSGNAVSLTLGLPDSESLSFSGGTNQPFFNSQNIQLGRRVELDEQNKFSITNAPSPSQSRPAYDNINIQNRKRFATQLRSDYLA